MKAKQVVKFIPPPPSLLQGRPQTPQFASEVFAKEACSVLEQKFVRRRCLRVRHSLECAPRSLSSGSAQPTQVNDTPDLERPHGPPTEAEDGDYAAGALGVAALSLTAPHSVQASYGLRCAPCPCPHQACATGEELKCAQHKLPQEAEPLQVRNPS